MNAIVFKITEFTESSLKEGEIIMTGIVKDIYDTIYPQTETGINEMPYEIEIKHFEVNGYKLTYFEVDIPYEDCEKFRTSTNNF